MGVRGSQLGNTHWEYWDFIGLIIKHWDPIKKNGAVKLQKNMGFSQQWPRSGKMWPKCGEKATKLKSWNPILCMYIYCNILYI